MRQARARLKPLTVAGNGDSEPLSSASLSLTDYSGRKRQGRALLLSEWPSNSGSEHLAEGEDFRIVVLSEPPEGAISPEEGVVVVAPARRLASATATYSAAEQLACRHATPPDGGGCLRWRQGAAGVAGL